MTRIDVWLCAVRLFKTRTAANDAVSGGHVRLNDAPVKPAHPVVLGDVVTVKEPGWEHRYEVTRLINKRVGAPSARECYIDHSPPKPAFLVGGPVGRRAPGAGRPTKKQRREIDKLINGDGESRLHW